MSGLTYKGQHSSEFGLVIKTKPSILPPISTKTTEIPGMPGAYYVRSERGVKPIKVPIGFVADDYQDYHTRLRRLAAWLAPPKDIKDGALIFDTESYKTDYAVLDGSTDIDRLARLGKGTLTFLCPDPDSFGQERTQTINDPNNPTKAGKVITNGGTAETKPVFRATILKQTPLLAIVSPDDYIQLGKPASVDQPAVQGKELILRDEMTTLTNWTTGSYIEDGVIAGSMTTGDSHFKASDFGTGDGWHGPALERSLSEAIQDFEVDFYLSNVSSGDPKKIGRVEVYLLDAQGNVVAKAGIKDAHQDYILNRGYIRIGSKFIINETKNIWNNFDGMIHIQRDGKRWIVGIGQIDENGDHHARHYETWTDYGGEFQSKVAKVEVYIGKYADYTVSDMWHGAVYVYKHNSISNDQVPYILQPDDEVVIDHRQRKVFVNGKDARNLKYFPSNYFKLKPGQTELGVSPADVAKVDIEYPEAWL
ncbi:distal tail protein Dit [Tuberibacillus sp. Marseille-P3662]|uniref:distal tail protein Dit n=1 Tax=Tuberibacillus sp. Marseille-P3662 TaxID=1965358 RepID=UPI000A1CC70A|nr:distal tail protein Dit [Tuberibacillus sp. Marseille-P3662]